MEDCYKCGVPLGMGIHWTIGNEIQRCIWESPESMPEVDIQSGESFAYYCCEQHAMEATEEYLLQVGATAQWSDVRPIETCACCGRDFDTTKWHKVLVLYQERGSILINPEMIHIDYVARFCADCVPCS